MFNGYIKFYMLPLLFSFFFCMVFSLDLQSTYLIMWIIIMSLNWVLGYLLIYLYDFFFRFTRITITHSKNENYVWWVNEFKCEFYFLCITDLLKLMNSFTNWIRFIIKLWWISPSQILHHICVFLIVDRIWLEV